MDVGSLGTRARFPSERPADATGVRRLLMLGGFLIFVAAALALFGHAFGSFALVAIFSLLAMVGIAAIFAYALGFVSIAPAQPSREIASAFLDALSTGTVIVDRRGQILYANDAFDRATGAGGGLERRTLDRVLMREREGSEAVYRLASRGALGEAASEEFRLEGDLAGRAEAGPRWYRATVRPLEADGNAALAWQIADVTAERAEQEAFFQKLQSAVDYLDRAPAGFFATDEKGRIVHLNAALAGWLGIDLAGFKAGERGLTDILGSDVAGYLTSRDGAVSGAVDAALPMPDNRRLPVRLHFERAVGVAGIASSIQAIVVRRGEENPDGNAVHAAELRFAQVVNSSPIAIAALDRTNRVTRTNAAFAALFGENVASGDDLAALICDDNRATLVQNLGEARSFRATRQPLDLQTAGDPPRSVRLYLGGTGDESDELILYGIDITEQRRLEEQYAKAERLQAIGTLAGGIAHDFNNALTVITASVDFTLMNHRPNDPSFPDLLLIKQSANRAAELVRQLLAYSRRQTMRPTVLNLTDVVADMHLMLKRVSGDLVRFERRHARDLWPVMADIGQFDQVLTNLVGNARDAMPNGGTVTVSTRNVTDAETRAFAYTEMTGGEFVLVEVTDTGTGMPPDVAGRIFEPFFTTKEIGKGTGLGLSMVYGIVKQSGGFIYVDSTPGQGTTFRIFLPRFVAGETSARAETAVPVVPNGAPATANAAAPPTETEDLSGTASILLVEDEDNVRSMAVRLLEMRGYEVHAASSGVEALERMEEIDGRVDLVVSDVVMPEMDGPTLLRELRQRWPGLKFIFASGYAEDAFSKNLPEGEKFGFLAKPYSLRDLAVAVRRNLDAPA